MPKNYTMISKLLSTTFIALLFGVVNTTFAQDHYSKEKEILDNIAQLIKEKNTNDLSDYFGNSIQLKIPGNKGIFSSKQSKFLLQEFFTENSPVNITFEKREENHKGTIYAILLYSAEENKYRVYYRLKKTKEEYKIHTFEINKIKQENK